MFNLLLVGCFRFLINSYDAIDGYYFTTS